MTIPAPAALDPLTRLAIRHGTDKFGQHLYTPIYDRLFGHLRDHPIKFLEIGVGWSNISTLGGASLAMWRDYFQHAQLVGIDVMPKRLNFGPRVQILQGSQTDTDFLRQVWHAHGPFDVVVDDGSHVVQHVLTSFETLYPLMQEGGFYAIEDTQTAFWPDFGGNAQGENSILSRAYDIAKAMHAQEVQAGGTTPAEDQYGAVTTAVHFHRNMVVFERGVNDFPSNRRWSIGHPAVQKALGQMDQARADDKSVGEVVTRLGMLEVAGETAQALEVARAGIRDFPDSLPILTVLQHMAWKMGSHEESRVAMKRMLELVPDEPFFLMTDQKMREAT